MAASQPNFEAFFFLLPSLPFFFSHRLFFHRQLIYSFNLNDYYITIIISDHAPDHAPVFLDISFALNIKQRPLWKLDPLVLSDEDFSHCLAINIDIYISTNKKENTSYSLLWESLKAYLIISYVAFTKREHSKEVLSLTDSIHKLD